MKEAAGNIFSGSHDWLVFTANSTVTKDGRLVMGAGIAKQVLERYPGIDRFFGSVLQDNGYAGGRYNLAAHYGHRVMALQTKIDWRNASDLNLVVESVSYLAGFSLFRPTETIATVRPGCGLGNLDWDQVKPRIAPLLPDNVTVYGHN